MQMLSELSRLPGHHFWTVDFDLVTAVKPVEDRFLGHQQVSDIYLLAVAVRNKGKLVTLDRGLTFLAGEEFAGSVVRL